MNQSELPATPCEPRSLAQQTNQAIWAQGPGTQTGQLITDRNQPWQCRLITFRVIIPPCWHVGGSAKTGSMPKENIWLGLVWTKTLSWLQRSDETFLLQLTLELWPFLSTMMRNSGRLRVQILELPSDSTFYGSKFYSSSLLVECQECGSMECEAVQTVGYWELTLGPQVHLGESVIVPLTVTIHCLVSLNGTDREVGGTRHIKRTQKVNLATFQNGCLDLSWEAESSLPSALVSNSVVLNKGVA